MKETPTCKLKIILDSAIIRKFGKHYSIFCSKFSKLTMRIHKHALHFCNLYHPQNVLMNKYSLPSGAKTKAETEDNAPAKIPPSPGLNGNRHRQVEMIGNRPRPVIPSNGQAPEHERRHSRAQSRRNRGRSPLRIGLDRSSDAPISSPLGELGADCPAYPSKRPVASRSRSYRLVSGKGGNQGSRRMVQSS